jgi:hypothetical protein
VPSEKSHYSFFNRKERTMIAYQGTLLVDPKKVDLVRLIVTGQPSPESGTCEITTTMDYGRVRLNSSDFLLPTETHLKIVNRSGDEFDNQTVYSSCHEFLGESTLTFEPPPEPATKGRAVSSNDAAVELPAGIPFTVALTQDIDCAVAATGDPITARLATAIRDEASKVLVAEGARITGRIIRMRRFYGQSALFLVAVKLETLDAGGAPRPFSATVYRNDADSAERTGFSIGGWNLGPTTTLTDSGVAVFEFQDTTENPRESRDQIWAGIEVGYNHPLTGVAQKSGSRAAGVRAVGKAVTGAGIAAGWRPLVREYDVRRWLINRPSERTTQLMFSETV